MTPPPVARGLGSGWHRCLTPPTAALRGRLIPVGTHQGTNEIHDTSGGPVNAVCFFLVEDVRLFHDLGLVRVALANVRGVISTASH